jgi:hypothetical protein
MFEAYQMWKSIPKKCLMLYSSHQGFMTMGLICAGQYMFFVRIVSLFKPKGGKRQIQKAAFQLTWMKLTV